jgi:hypothetical protein
VFLSKRFAYKLKKPLHSRRERTSWYFDAATGPAECATSRRAAR